MHLEDAVVGPRVRGDDLRVGTRLRRLLAPAAATGRLLLASACRRLGWRRSGSGILAGPNRVVRSDNGLRDDADDLLGRCAGNQREHAREDQ